MNYDVLDVLSPWTRFCVASHRSGQCWLVDSASEARIWVLHEGVVNCNDVIFGIGVHSRF